MKRSDESSRIGFLGVYCGPALVGHQRKETKKKHVDETIRRWSQLGH